MIRVKVKFALVNKKGTWQYKVAHSLKIVRAVCLLTMKIQMRKTKETKYSDAIRNHSFVPF